MRPVLRWGIGRVGSQIEANARLAMRAVRVRDSDVVIDSGGFVTLRGEPLTEPRYPQGPESRRKPRQLPPAEVRAAVTRVVDDAVVAEEDQVARAIAQFFGWNTTEEVRRLTSQSLARLVHNGLLEKNGGSYRLATRRG